MHFILYLQDKPVPIPGGPKEWKPKDAPDFVRFYMGEDLVHVCVISSLI